MSKHGTAKQRAKRGAKWLDKKSPGWFRKIRRGRLNLSEPCDCILGQLNGDYEAVARKLGLEAYGSDARELGFLPAEGERDWEIEGKVYAGPLESAWWDEIRDRRAKARP